MLDEEIALVYRSNKNKRYSIETLFSSLNKQVNVKKIVLPEDLNSIYNFFKLWVVPKKKLFDSIIKILYSNFHLGKILH